MIIFQTLPNTKSYLHFIYNISLYNTKIFYTCNIMCREQMDNHLEKMQTELENLREILHSEGYSIDANTLLGVILKFLMF